MKHSLFYCVFFALMFAITACGDDGDSATRPSEESSSSVALSSSSAVVCLTGNFLDSRDGQTYKTVTIGSQTWMAQNLNYKVADSYCDYDSTQKCEKYGRFYTLPAAITACPSGWRLPDTTEWKLLFTTVGGSSTAGKKLKSTSGWNGYKGNGDDDTDVYFNGNGTDAYSFSVLSSWGYQAYFWSSTGYENNSIYAYYIIFKNYNDFVYLDSVYLDSEYKYNNFSVRCVTDDISFAIAACGDGGGTAEKSSSSVAQSSSSETLRVVDPASVVKGTFSDSRDGQTYKTVTIDTLTWMAENLNYETANSYCYNDSVEYCSKYGRLYTWAAAMDSAGLWSTNGKGCGVGSRCSPTYPVRGVCPEGWHLPKQSEWNTLASVVGASSFAGKKLKSTSGWFDYNGKSGNGTDDYSFSALPAGCRGRSASYQEGHFSNFWSATESSSFGDGDAEMVFLGYADNYMGSLSDSKGYGFSVRCVKD